MGNHGFPTRPLAVAQGSPVVGLRRAKPGSGREAVMHRSDRQTTADSGAVAENLLRLVPAAAAAIFDEGGNVLLTRRADNGLWCLPGGEMEPGESLSNTVIRETFEETGLRVTPEQPVGVYSLPHPYYTGQGRHVIGFVFLCRVVGGDLRLSPETTEFGYFDPAALPTDIVPTHVERILDAVDVRDGAGFRVR